MENILYDLNFPRIIPVEFLILKWENQFLYFAILIKPYLTARFCNEYR